MRDCNYPGGDFGSYDAILPGTDLPTIHQNIKNVYRNIGDSSREVMVVLMSASRLSFSC